MNKKETLQSNLLGSEHATKIVPRSAENSQDYEDEHMMNLNLSSYMRYNNGVGKSLAKDNQNLRSRSNMNVSGLGNMAGRPLQHVIQNIESRRSLENPNNEK